MYIGGVDSRSLHHLLWEIVDNSIDEHMNGHGDAIAVTLHSDGRSLTVADNGRGIPVDKVPKKNKNALEVILTELYSGGKFSGKNYAHAGGLHGVGASVVNALSKELVATVKRDGFEYRQSFSRGKPTGELEKVGPFRGHGTAIFFRPDEKIFPRTQFVSETIKSQLEDVSYLHPGLKLTFKDDTKKETHQIHNPGGIRSFLAKMVTESQKNAVVEQTFFVEKQGVEKIQATLTWTEATDESIRSYANGIRTPNGGTHEAGFRTAVVRAIRNYLETHQIPLKGITITAEDIREGVFGIISVMLPEPQFQSQTKDKLNNADLNNVVDGIVRPALENWLNGNPSLADKIVGRIVLAARAREASREAVSEIKRKGPTSRKLNLPGKLADCTSTTKPENSELFIVEGDSAGGSAKQGRNAKYQAVLPLWGKVMNCEGMSHAKTLQHQAFADLTQALGAGVGPSFDAARLRYGKIIMLMDADYDGHHITTLLLTFFFRNMPKLIEQGHLYIAKPPLYKIRVGKDQTFWAHDDVQKEEIFAGLKPNAKVELTRFKGLGEMPARTLAETTLDVRTRTLLKVRIDSMLETDKTFVSLMGKDASLRYSFIMDSAGLADDLDI